MKLIIVAVICFAFVLGAKPKPQISKDWMLEFGSGLLDGITNGGGNASESQCRASIIQTRDVADEFKIVVESFKYKNSSAILLQFVKHSFSQMYNVARDCQMIALLSNIFTWSNPWTVVIKLLKVAVFKFPSLIKADFNIVSGILGNQPFQIGLGVGINLSVFLDWSIY